VSWPYSPRECPLCRSFAELDPPVLDDVGYEIVGFCRNPRIAMDLFVFKERDPETMEPCPCFRPQEASGVIR
jgi:hypothetical protein